MDLNCEIPYGPILHPTSEEFSDHKKYLERLGSDESLSQYGLIKVALAPPIQFVTNCHR